jgi:hypothetical protein
MANLYAPDGTRIIGTCETLKGTCLFHNEDITIDTETGEFQFQYVGGTEVDWNGQVTSRDQFGMRLFFDENYGIWPESALCLK